MNESTAHLLSHIIDKVELRPRSARYRIGQKEKRMTVTNEYGIITDEAAKEIVKQISDFARERMHLLNQFTLTDANLVMNDVMSAIYTDFCEYRLRRGIQMRKERKEK